MAIYNSKKEISLGNLWAVVLLPIALSLGIIVSVIALGFDQLSQFSGYNGEFPNEVVWCESCPVLDSEIPESCPAGESLRASTSKYVESKDCYCPGSFSCYPD